ncbi:5'-nucleotidase C-terminal domain-containing protein [Clostridium senegalense]|uniref:5'-nucleotidase C-terminal domain-containing protein n=1 Tax=Clostridium senegalense TaxID=1465809 RepID=UPI001C10AD38|nr:5'-nucleotidase C-terminal domain-containing protein [Clostridium senegalense]MBU5226419.1 5'-nucleotidase C-terminal domain-containing protein [Clostridium senegalense]
MFKKLKGKKQIATVVALSIVTSLTLGSIPTKAFANNEVKEIQVLGTSDLHGWFMSHDYASNEEQKKGGLTQISSLFKQLKSENPNTIIVDAGDTVQDNMSDLFINDDIHPMLYAMDEIGYTSWTLGNHEFNYGDKVVEKTVNKPEKMKVLCGNVYKPDESLLGQPYVIEEIDGVRIANIGMTTPNILKWDGPKLPGYKVTDPVSETRKAIDKIKSNNEADVIIATVHMGKNKEYIDGDNATDLANACPELAAIICGHAHSKIPGDIVNGVLITEPGKQGEQVSKINLKVSKNKDGKYSVIDKQSDIVNVKDYPIDQELNEKLKPFHDKAVEEATQIIGTLTGGNLAPQDEIKGITQGQIQDTAVMDLILNTQLYYTKKHIPEGARNITSAALFSPSANINEGTIRKCDVVKIYKFDNTLYTLKINGTQLKKYMEWSANYYNQYKDGDLTVSFNPEMRGYEYDMFAGVNYDINIYKPTGQRIENLTYEDGSKVNDNDVIYLTANDYRTSTRLLGDLFKDDNVEVIHKTADDEVSAVRDLIREYIINEKGGKIQPDVDNNWKITGYNFDPDKREAAVRLINEGKVNIPTSEDGRSQNIRSITWDDIKDFVPELENPKDDSKENPNGKPEIKPEEKPNKDSSNKEKSSTNNKNNNDKSLPQTGSKYGTKDIIELGVIFLILGAGITLYSNKNKFKKIG